MTTFTFKNVYVLGSGTAVGPLEQAGPLKDCFDIAFKDNYCNEENFELAEQNLVRNACDYAVRKANISINDIDIAFGGDLINQLTSSNYFAKDINASFVGIYGACSTSSLSVALASFYIENSKINHALAFTSSHAGTAERQFRFPNEYGVQKKDTTTLTVTGAGAFVLSKHPSNIKVTQATIGKVIDWDFKNVSDMGQAMTPAAYDTITAHFKNTNTNFKDYDLIVTGDLSKIGHKFLLDLFQQNNYDTMDKLHDSGLMIYDILKQNVFCGGSGCGCSACVTITKLFELLKSKQMKRIMVVATGALLSPVAVHQKQSIPCIAHAVVYERNDVK